MLILHALIPQNSTPVPLQRCSSATPRTFRRKPYPHGRIGRVPTRLYRPAASCSHTSKLHILFPQTDSNAIASSIRPSLLKSRRIRIMESSGEPSSARSEEHTSELQSPYDLVCR